MHALSFGFKRAHWSAVRIGKEVLESVEGMTPARFDLLYLLRRVRLDDPLITEAGDGLTQDALWKGLGVHPSTVSKMMARLLEMGWVRRSRYAPDTRRWLVRLTDLGMRKVWKAMRILFRCRALLATYETLFPTGPAGHVVKRIHGVVTMLKRVAYAFRDRARAWFDYGHPPANVSIVQMTEPRYLRWMRVERMRARMTAMALVHPAREAGEGGGALDSD
jgi:DNA-binding MarR family transcriptional regulator